MYERIMRTGRFVTVNPNTVNEIRIETFRVYSADMREVLITLPGFNAAKAYLENEVKREKLSCPTGGCED